MQSLPLVSVVIPTLNRPWRLRQALESIYAQTCEDVEVIVVNDGGDSVEDIVEPFRALARFPLQLIALQATQGLAHARNSGVLVAKGEFIALLDDDDRFRPAHLAQLVSALQTHPEATLTYDDVLILIEEVGSDETRPRVIGSCRFGRPYDKEIFEQNDFIVPSSMVFRHNHFAAVDGFDETMTICEDWDFLMRLREHGTFHYVDRTIGVEYSFRPASMDNLSSVFGASRQAALDLISARYDLPLLAPKTFLDVARDLGFHIQLES